MLRPLTVTADTVEAVHAGKPANFSWHELLNGRKPDDPANSKRKFIDIQPKLDFTALEPGKAATDAIRKAAADLKLAEDYGARVRLTGPVPIADEEFATVQEGMLINGIGTVADRAGDPVARAAIRPDHPGGVSQPARRARDHGGARIPGGRRRST